MKVIIIAELLKFHGLCFTKKEAGEPLPEISRTWTNKPHSNVNVYDYTESLASFLFIHSIKHNIVDSVDLLYKNT